MLSIVLAPWTEHEPKRAYEGNFKAELEIKLAPWDSSLTISHQLISHLILVPTGDANPREFWNVPRREGIFL